MRLTELANMYGWQLAFALDWAQRSGQKFKDEHQLVSLYFKNIGMSLKEPRVQKLADEIARALTVFATPT